MTFHIYIYCYMICLNVKIQSATGPLPSTLIFGQNPFGMGVYDFNERQKSETAVKQLEYIS
jgi:hypothetical protein